MKYAFLTLVLFLSISTSIMAQKYGHINSQALILEMPEIKQADTQIQAYQKSLVTKGEGMIKDLQTQYQAIIKKAENNELSPIQLQEEEAKLAAKQQSIQAYDNEMQQKVIIKRQELYAPVFQKVDKAIKAVGAEGNYTMIFDTSTGTILFAEESEDITGQVRTKLGL